MLYRHGLQFFPDRLGALSEMHRVLEPGGVAVDLGRGAPAWDCRADVTRVPRGRRQSSLSSGLRRQSHVFGVSELHDLVSGAGFRDVIVDMIELGCVWETSGGPDRRIAAQQYVRDAVCSSAAPATVLQDRPGRPRSIWPGESGLGAQSPDRLDEFLVPSCAGTLSMDQSVSPDCSSARPQVHGHSKRCSL